MDDDLEKALKDATEFLDTYGLMDSQLKRNQPVPISQIQPTLDIIRDLLENYEHTVCGSIRRGAPAARDIDLVVSPKFAGNLQQTMEEVVRLFLVFGMELVSQGWRGACFVVTLANREPMRVDVLFCEHYAQGGAILYMTGSAAWNQALRNHCISQNMEMTTHSIMDGGKPYFFKTEEAVLRYMGVVYLEPEFRVGPISLR